MVAEEASTWPGVSRPPAEGGLGFDFKWDMGWMNDTLQFMHLDGHRRNDQLKRLTFRMLYAFSENFLLALSHDEVVHCKGSLWQKMWGNNWEKFAGLRLLYGYTYAQPGKKLLFMGDEFAQIREWNHDHSLDWDLLNHATHAGVQRCVQDLNRLYRTLPALHEIDGEQAGFEWIACDDTTNGVFSFLRKAHSTDDLVLVVCNFSPQVRRNYRVGLPRNGFWQEIFNSDAEMYGGGGLGNYGGFNADTVASNSRPYSLNLTLPPLSTMFFKSQAEVSKSED
jgi:1,4-alpha-glucan branching enzyme